jgi:prophage antirepressor-like protein
MTPGGVQRFRVLTRSDVLRLVMNSELPAAQRLEKWVLDEVLPSIMETASYIGGQFDLTEPTSNRWGCGRSASLPPVQRGSDK